MNTLNQAIENALKYANSQTYKGINILSNHYNVFEYWKNKETIEWDDLCNFANMKFPGFKTTKFSLCMLVYFLEHNLYQSKHKEKLMYNLSYLKHCISNFNSCCTIIFTGDFNEVYFLDVPNSKMTTAIVRLHNCNNFYGSLYIKYLQSTKNNLHYGDANLDYHFMSSLKNVDEITSLDDIDASVFWCQVDYFKSFYKDDIKNKTYAIRTLCRFYRWLLNEYNEHVFFTNAPNLTYELFFSTTLVKNILKDAYFTSITSSEDLGDRARIVFIIKNMHHKSTEMVKNSHYTLNTNEIESSFYRALVNKYVQNFKAPSMLTSNTYISGVISALHFIEQAKMYKNYPNPSFKNFNVTEAQMIRDYFVKKSPESSLHTLNNKIGAIRRFFQWCQKCNYLTFDKTFFDNISQYEEPTIFNGKAIPDSDLVKLNEAFLNLCKKNSIYKNYYAIFLILLETEFRVSQICNLKVSSLQPTLKNDQFLLYSNTKTSNGKKISQPICLSTKKILESIIESNEELRNEVLQASYKDYIFLTRTHTINKDIRGINAQMFNQKFKKVCETAGTPFYNAKNLRDTHMTKAYEYILRNNRSDLEMSVLSRHKHIDTTKNSYIEMSLTKMLESTYKVTLDNRDINQQKKILDTLPDNLKNSETVVENGCGHCVAKSCHMTGSLPCLICDDFITTVDRKPYFINMIENCDKLIENTTIRHEIEDINLIKTLYTNWLREIYIKEAQSNANTINN